MSVTKAKLVNLTVANNAEWCHLVCETNGAPGQFSQQVWYSTYEVPRFYPNIITLTADCSLKTVQAITQQILGNVSIKDSFNTLSPDRLGFKKLFDAQWLLAPSQINEHDNYRLVTDVHHLEQWETAWNGAPSTGVFNTSLLHHPSVRFIAIYQDDQLVAGGIVNKSEGVVGLTNLFCQARDPAPFWLTCLAAAQAFGAGLPTVTYASGTVLELARSIGFKELGPLSVWLKNRIPLDDL